jgi:hypothetical protein
MTKWIEFVKEFASKKGMSYKNALKDPECKKEYHSSKTEGGALAKEPVLVPPPMPKRERKTKKPIIKVEPESPKDISEANASGQNITMEVLEGGPKPKKERKRPKKTVVDMVGEGVLKAGYTTEAVNGLEHIYPISHDMVLKIVKSV